MAEVSIKPEKGYVPPQFCVGCFATDRQLSRTGQLADVLFYILDIFNPNLNMEQALICWECEAILKKIILFKNKANSVQNFLNATDMLTQVKSLPRTLSKLSKSVNTNVITLYHDELDIPIKQIKTEAQEFVVEIQGSYNLPIHVKKEELSYYWDDEDLSEPDEAETTNVEPTRKKPKMKPRFRLIKDIKTKRRNVRFKKIKIEEEALEAWLETDRENEAFLKSQYKCVNCQWGTNSEEEYRSHNSQYHSEKSGPYECEICHCKFENRFRLGQHIRFHYFAHQCDVCGYKCYNKHNMIAHIVMYHENNVKCLRCKLCFQDLGIFHKHHEDMHTKFQCDMCGKVCSSKTNIQSHLYNKHGGTECRVCNKQFKNRAILIVHNQVEHPDTFKPELAYCVECGKQFESELALKQHIEYSKAHNNKRQQYQAECPECHKKYTRNYSMVNHYRAVHLKVTKFFCEDCNKYFLNRTRYLEHRKYQHEGFKPEKNKVCPHCGKLFASKRELELHSRTHTKEKPFECTICFSRFSQKSAVRMHMKRIHPRGQDVASAPGGSSIARELLPI